MCVATFPSGEERAIENFYATLAQVLPLLLLAFIWDSGFLVRLRQQRRLPRRADPTGVRFWTKPRVCIYTLLVTAVVIISIAVTVLVLAGIVPDSRALRLVLSAGLGLVLVTLLTRITFDVLWATSTKSTTSSGPEMDTETVSPPITTQITDDARTAVGEAGVERDAKQP